MPFLGYEDAAAAIEWLSAAFGATESGERYTADDGTIVHAELSFGADALVFISTPTGYVNPKRRRALAPELDGMYDNPWVIDGMYIGVDDFEAHYRRAVEHGVTIVREPTTDPNGAPIYTAEDPEGHRWMFGGTLGS